MHIKDSFTLRNKHTSGKHACSFLESAWESSAATPSLRCHQTARWQERSLTAYVSMRQGNGVWHLSSKQLITPLMCCQTVNPMTIFFFFPQLYWSAFSIVFLNPTLQQVENLRKKRIFVFRGELSTTSGILLLYTMNRIYSPNRDQKILFISPLPVLSFRLWQWTFKNACC